MPPGTANTAAAKHRWVLSPDETVEGKAGGLVNRRIREPELAFDAHQHTHRCLRHVVVERRRPL